MYNFFVVKTVQKYSIWLKFDKIISSKLLQYLDSLHRLTTTPQNSQRS